MHQWRSKTPKSITLLIEGETDPKKSYPYTLRYFNKIKCYYLSNTTLCTKKVMNILKIFTSIVEAKARKTP